MSIREVDIRLALWLLLPESEYQWIGTQNIGHNLEEAIGEWRDPDNPLPGETALVLAYQVYLSKNEGT